MPRTQPLTDMNGRGLKWIWHPKNDRRTEGVFAFRNRFEIDASETVRIHISADQRYQLFLDGARIGTGPERGDLQRWFYETYDLDLDAGAHTMVVLAWWLDEAHTPRAQITEQAGIVVAVEGRLHDALATGTGSWQVKTIGGIRCEIPEFSFATGASFHIDGAGTSFDFSSGAGDGWRDAVAVDDVYTRTDPGNPHGLLNGKWLAPAMLPPQRIAARAAGTCRYAESFEGEPHDVVEEAHSDAGLCAEIQSMLNSQTAWTVPPHTRLRTILDVDDYTCAYPRVTVTGGAGATIRLFWAEALFVATPKYLESRGTSTPEKQNRDDIHGKQFMGQGDHFYPSGGERETFTTLWWRAGRYLELRIETAAEPLTIETLALDKTGYALDDSAEFHDTSEPRFEAFTAVGLRTLQMCSHETSMDCPYYEQLQYVGDARLQFLVHYCITPIDALARKAILQYDEARMPYGLCRASYPYRDIQVIASFTPAWIGMLYDYAQYRGDAAFVSERLDGCRTALGYFHSRTCDDLISKPLDGWNFHDWAADWTLGVPNLAEDGIGCLINLEYHAALAQVAELEAAFGDPVLAELYDARRSALGCAIIKRFWSDDRQALADDTGHRAFSEHVQARAVGCALGSDDQRAAMLELLCADNDLTRTTIYYAHHLFCVLLENHRYDAFLRRMEDWFTHTALGLKTCMESPEPTRSDCHAWGAHPIYHYHRYLLGVRPAEFGFGRVTIAPVPGPDTHRCGRMVHPDGMIEVDLNIDGPRLDAKITLPEDVSGILEWKGSTADLRAGTQEIRLG